MLSEAGVTGTPWGGQPTVFSSRFPLEAAGGIAPGAGKDPFASIVAIILVTNYAA
jgi:hypothetical protein